MDRKYHSLLPMQAQDALMTAVKAATAYAISKAPNAFKSQHDREA